jgi:ABC-2 type transport system ATP-binding protein
MIEVQNLTKYYGHIKAVDHISFAVAKGEIVGLLGPNGSGKTTTMRILTGFFPPTEGRAIVAGLDVETHSLEVRNRIGYLPENVALYPDMPVRGFLDFCAQVKGVPALQRRASLDKVIAECGLKEMAKRLIGKLSKGYRQRVGLAQALLYDPEVLILDEPTIGLDPMQVVEIRELIKGLQGKTTVLLSTHILPEVSLSCQRVVIIDRGRIIAEDTTAGLNRRVQDATRVLVRVEGPTDEVPAVLRALPGVSEVAEQNSNEERGQAFLLTSKNTDIGQQAAAAIVSKGWALLEVRPAVMTLEELFVQLTRSEEGSRS